MLVEPCPGGDGGGIYNSGTLTLINSTVSDNTTGNGAVASGFPGKGGGGGDGGGIYNGGTLTLTNSTVSSNITGHGGAGSGDIESSGGDGGDGGGVYDSDTLMVINSTVSSNTTGSGGAPSGFSEGGDGGDGGGLYLVDSNATLSGNTVSANIAHDDGGGLYLNGSDATLNATTVTANTATWYGGGLYLWSSDAELTNNVIADSQANIAGSGLYITAHSSPQLLHNTIARNSSGDGSGVHVTGNSGVAFLNTVLVSHTIGITVTAGSTATFQATLWGSDAWANDTDWNGEGTIITGTRNYWGNPDFVDPEAGDYHIGPDSAAIDVGVDAGGTTDIDGEPRPDGCWADIGADEYQGRTCHRTYLPVVTKIYSTSRDVNFMESSGRKPRCLRRGGRPVPRTREQRFADDSGKRCWGGVNVLCYNSCRESKAGSSHGLSVGLPLCLDSPVPPQGTDGGCGAAAGGIDPRDLRRAGLGSGGIDGAAGSCTLVRQLSASGCARKGDECAEEYHSAGVVRWVSTLAPVALGR